MENVDVLQCPVALSCASKTQNWWTSICDSVLSAIYQAKLILNDLETNTT